MKKHILNLVLSCVICLSLLISCNTQKDKTNSKDTTINNTETQHVQEPEQAPAVEEPPVEYRTSFIGVGDNIIYGTKEAKIKATTGGRKYNYKPYYDGVSDIIENADIAFINQETLMCGDGYALSYYPRFNSPRELGYDLVEMGFDVVSIANNHMLDKGADGLSKTIEFWKGMDVLMVGGYENNEDYDKIRFIERNGLKIAFLSYTYFTNGLTKPDSSELAIPYTNDADIIRQTRLAKECADLVFVSVHWGDEGSFTPNDEQKRLAQLFSDCGVDVILGHHPHVIQPVEYLTGEGGNVTLCVYSLGNFMAQQNYDYNMVGGMICFDIVHTEGNEAEARIENPVFIPTVFHFNGSFTNNNVYRFEDYTRELASLHGVRTYYGHTLTYDRMLGYITNTIDKAFLPEFYKAQNGIEMIE